MKNSVSWFAVGLLALVACGAPVRPVVFVTSHKTSEVLDSATRVLAIEGQQVVRRDDAAGVMDTDWSNTGFKWGQVQNQSAVIVRRYKVVATPGEAGITVSVRIDAKQCPEGGFAIEHGQVLGACNELVDIPDTMQQDINAMAARIQMALDKNQ